MKIAIFGASGGCGTQLVQQAKERGMDAAAVVRSATWQAPEGVKVLRGDLLSEAFLREAIRGQDAVLSAVGLRLPGIAPWHKPEVPDLLTRHTPALVAAAKAEGLKRYIGISAGGVGDSYAAMPGFFRAMIRTTALKHSYRELDVMEQALLKSGLDVLICRPTGLTDGPRTGQVKVAPKLNGNAQISRADVAAWMLDALASPTPTDRTPVITVTGAA